MIEDKPESLIGERNDGSPASACAGSATRRTNARVNGTAMLRQLFSARPSTCLNAAEQLIQLRDSFARQPGRFNGGGVDALLLLYDLQELRLIGARSLDARRGKLLYHRWLLGDA